MVTNIGDALAAYKNTVANAGDNTKSQVESVSFGDVLQKMGSGALENVRGGEQAMNAAALGRASITDVVTAVASAEATLETVIALRDRIMTAYQEISRTNV